MNNVIWITGAKGRIGSELKKKLSTPDNKILVTDMDLDITDTEDVINYAVTNRPDYIINCAGMTDVEACEKDMVAAFRGNALGARNLSTAARQVNAIIIQLSTDDVFAGDSIIPVTEFDGTNPISVYGKSKYAGEKFVESLDPKHIIVRSSWLYGHGDSDFISDIISKAQNNEEICMPVNFIGTPTSASALADFILALIGEEEYGTFHASCEGFCSRYEYAKAVLKYAGIDYEVKPVEYTGEGIMRPQKVILENLMMKMTGIYEMPLWEDELKRYMEEER